MWVAVNTVVVCAVFQTSLACDNAADYCNLEWSGDGRCDPDYNNPECCYDGGDCCEHTCVNGASTCGQYGYDCKVEAETLSPTPAPTGNVPGSAPPTTSPTMSPTSSPTIDCENVWCLGLGSFLSQPSNPVVDILCGGNMCVAVFNNGAAEAWGDPLFGGSPQYAELGGVIVPVVMDASSAGAIVVAASCGESACAVKFQDGSARTWGWKSIGGDPCYSSGCTENPLVDVDVVTCAGTMCFAIFTDGRMLNWGTHPAPASVLTDGSSLAAAAASVSCGGFACVVRYANCSAQPWNANLGGSTSTDLSYSQGVDCWDDGPCSATHEPTKSPTSSPSTSPTVSPTSSPSTSPTVSPTSSPSTSPTVSPTSSPGSPTSNPTPPLPESEDAGSPISTGVKIVIAAASLLAAGGSYVGYTTYLSYQTISSVKAEFLL